MNIDVGRIQNKKIKSLMETEATVDQNLKELRVSVDHILQTLHAINFKQDNLGMTLQTLSGKMDIYGQRLKGVEGDVKNIKVAFLNSKNCLPTSGWSEVEGAERNQPPTSEINEVSSTHAYSSCDERNKDPSKVSVNMNANEVFTFVREEFGRLDDATTRHASNVITRIELAKDSVLKPVRDVETDVKVNAARMESLGRRIRAIENSLLEHNELLKEMRDKYAPTKELKDSMQNLITIFEKQFDFLDKILPKDDLVQRLNSMKEISMKQNAVLEQIQGDYGIKGSINRMFIKQNQMLLDQMVCESQITREFVTRTRMSRKEYACDFFVTNFTDWTGSEDDQYSQIWYVDGIRTHSHLKAHVVFGKDYTIDVGLVHGRYPRVVGLKVQEGVSKMEVTVTAVGEVEEEAGGEGVSHDGKRLYWELGSDEVTPDEKDISEECDGWQLTNGWCLAKVSCQELKERGFVDGHDRLLLRYKILVL